MKSEYEIDNDLNDAQLARLARLVKLEDQKQPVLGHKKNAKLAPMKGSHMHQESTATMDQTVQINPS